MAQTTPHEPQPFKAHFGPTLLAGLAQRLLAAHPAFPAAAFLAEVAPQLEPLELKGRVAAIAAGLRRHLPPDFPAAVGLLMATLDPAPGEAAGIFSNSWHLMPVAAFVEHYGLDHPERSLQAMHTITQRHTAEFAIRPFLQRYPEQTLAALRGWARDPSLHVRRLVSEGTRPRLPWAARLPAFIADPAPVLELLELLKDDPSDYVRRSVANNLNDIAKDHPELVVATMARWREGASADRLRLIRHGLRTLVKQGSPAALGLLGAEAPAVELLALEVTPAALRIGEAATIAVTLRSTAPAPQQLVVDYVLHLPGARGRARRTVFKLRSQALAAGATLRLAKRHSFAPVSVRRIYPGVHRIAVQVNGVVLAEAAVEVAEA